jgi:hypothetical protein
VTLTIMLLPASKSSPTEALLGLPLLLLLQARLPGLGMCCGCWQNASFAGIRVLKAAAALGTAQTLPVGWHPPAPQHVQRRRKIWLDTCSTTLCGRQMLAPFH